MTRREVGHDDGFVTAETAVLLPVLVLVVVVLLMLVRASALQATAQDAAAMGARSAARGEDDTAARAAARVVPSGTAITVQRSGGLVTVDVRVPIPGAGPLGWLLGPWSVGARSSALDEQAS